MSRDNFIRNTRVGSTFVISIETVKLASSQQCWELASFTVSIEIRVGSLYYITVTSVICVSNKKKPTRVFRMEIIYDNSKQILASLATPIYLLLNDLSIYLTLKQIDINNNSIRGCQSRYLSPINSVARIYSVLALCNIVFDGLAN